MIKPDQITEAAFHSSNDTMLAAVGAKYITGGGIVTSVIGWLSSNEAAILLGVLVTIIGFIVNFIFQYKRDKRAKARDELETKILLEEHEAKMHIYKQGKLND